MSARPKGRRGFLIGAVMARTFSIWGRNIVPFTLLALIVHSPILYATWVYSNLEPGAEDEAKWAVIIRYGPNLLNHIVSGLVAYGVFRQLRGEPAAIGHTISAGLRRVVPVVLTGVVATLLIGLGLLALLIPGIILACMLWVAVPAAVVEGVGVGGALSRSAALTRGERGSIFLIMLLLWLVNLLVGIVAGIVVGVTDLTLLVWVTTVLGIVLGVLQAVAIAVGYHDLRLSKEGVGIDELVAVFD